jgi:hypothetical protein
MASFSLIPRCRPIRVVVWDSIDVLTSHERCGLSEACLWLSVGVKLDAAPLLEQRTMTQTRQADAGTHRWGSLALVMLSMLHFCSGNPPAHAQTTAKPNPPIEIPMELLFSRPVLRGTMNGQGPMVMLIDPQLQTTLISPGLADRLNLKRTQESSGTWPLSVELAFGATKFSKVPVEVRDTAPFLAELAVASRPAVVLSPSAWGDQLVTFDYGRFQVRLESGALPEPNKLDVYSLAQGSNELHVPLAIGGRSIDSRLDLLFPGGVLIPQSYLMELPLAGKPAEATPVRTREGSVTVRAARLADRMILAGVEVTSPLVLFGDVDRATVGYGALARLSITYDMTRGRARLNR